MIKEGREEGRKEERDELMKDGRGRKERTKKDRKL